MLEPVDLEDGKGHSYDEYDYGQCNPPYSPYSTGIYRYADDISHHFEEDETYHHPDGVKFHKADSKFGWPVDGYVNCAVGRGPISASEWSQVCSVKRRQRAAIERYVRTKEIGAIARRKVDEDLAVRNLATYDEHAVAMRHVEMEKEVLDGAEAHLTDTTEALVKATQAATKAERVRKEAEGARKQAIKNLEIAQESLLALSSMGE